MITGLPPRALTPLRPACIAATAGGLGDFAGSSRYAGTAGCAGLAEDGAGAGAASDADGAGFVAAGGRAVSATEVDDAAGGVAVFCTAIVDCCGAVGGSGAGAAGATGVGGGALLIVPAADVAGPFMARLGGTCVSVQT